MLLAMQSFARFFFTASMVSTTVFALPGSSSPHYEPDQVINSLRHLDFLPLRHYPSHPSSLLELHASSSFNEHALYKPTQNLSHFYASPDAERLELTQQTWIHDSRSYVDFEKFEAFLDDEQPLCTPHGLNRESILSFRFLLPSSYNAAKRQWAGRDDLIFVGEDPSTHHGEHARTFYLPSSINLFPETRTISVEARARDEAGDQAYATRMQIMKWQPSPSSAPELFLAARHSKHLAKRRAELHTARSHPKSLYRRDISPSFDYASFSTIWTNRTQTCKRVRYRDNEKWNSVACSGFKRRFWCLLEFLEHTFGCLLHHVSRKNASWIEHKLNTLINVSHGQFAGAGTIDLSMANSAKDQGRLFTHKDIGPYALGNPFELREINSDYQGVLEYRYFFDFDLNATRAADPSDPFPAEGLLKHLSAARIQLTAITPVRLRQQWYLHGEGGLGISCKVRLDPYSLDKLTCGPYATVGGIQLTAPNLVRPIPLNSQKLASRPVTPNLEVSPVWSWSTRAGSESEMAGGLGEPSGSVRKRGLSVDGSERIANHTTKGDRAGRTQEPSRMSSMSKRGLLDPIHATIRKTGIIYDSSLRPFFGLMFTVEMGADVNGTTPGIELLINEGRSIEVDLLSKEQRGTFKDALNINFLDGELGLSKERAKFRVILFLDWALAVGMPERLPNFIKNFAPAAVIRFEILALDVTLEYLSNAAAIARSCGDELTRAAAAIHTTVAVRSGVLLGLNVFGFWRESNMVLKEAWREGKVNNTLASGLFINARIVDWCVGATDRGNLGTKKTMIEGLNDLGHTLLDRPRP
ncbi:hypothetical protein K402DRAFT_388888 [Aulographum hederae CBS 113979]|uniref:Uncharacterized protein n=1 Tax=Aulographum hederae CBS 113979 TaxID=1176131 RepID=A0A6G1HEP3_9PEZI|nr:hypothetical protein K402DRAFT_388888 [Aulographum hederae CBS 113979]